MIARWLRRIGLERRLPPEFRDLPATTVRRWRRRLTDRAGPQPPKGFANVRVGGHRLVARTDSDQPVSTEIQFDRLVDRLIEAGVAFEVLAGPAGGRPRILVPHEARRSVARALHDPARRERHLSIDGGRPRPLTSRSHGGARWRVFDVESAGGDVGRGPDHAVELEFWFVDGDVRRRFRGMGHERIPVHEPPERARINDRELPVRAPYFVPSDILHADFAVDVVYTWVDGDDPAWREGLEGARRAASPRHPLADNSERFSDHDELRYSLRALHDFAPFVRRVHIVTAAQRPAWLADHPQVTLVDHRDILDGAYLPTFNSHVIESALHEIDGLAEHYLYLNDDFFLGRPVTAEIFFTPNGLCRFFPDRAPVPTGAPTAHDAPVDAAAKNGQALIRREFSRDAVWKLRHAPYAQRRSVVAEMVGRFAPEIDTTRSNRLRSPDDLSVASWLSHWYGFATGRAVVGEIASHYVNIHTRTAAGALERLLLERDADVFCLNETAANAERAPASEARARTFLDRYFPAPCPYETNEHR